MENQLVISTSRIEAPTEFHPFMRLPIELRTQIWEELIPEIHDRIIWVREPGWLKVDPKRFTSILLHVSPESRRIYLARFPMALNVCSCDLELGKGHILDGHWHNRGTIYINPLHDVLAIGQPWQESDTRDSDFYHGTTIFSDALGFDVQWTEEDVSENPYTGDDFALLARPLRRQRPRDRMRKLIEFPITMAHHPGDSEIEKSEWIYRWWEEYRWEEDSVDGIIDNENDDDPTESWDFNGVTKRHMFTGTLDNNQIWEFHRDMDCLSGSELLQKWNGNFTVIDE
ncbi:hypothetical protein PG985_001637 [Apiospora marii]|uniref:2EXR domain-containing protein n=1 Tax=Apiospora marii TaxID=335849 RepID=A0ABR1RIH0_9PEZI